MIVSPSYSLAELIALQNPSTPVEVIPNGIRVYQYDYSNRERNRILIVSRFFERKGVQYFLRALDGLSIPFKVDIVGTGPYLPTLKKIANIVKTSAEIEFHGWIDQKKPKLQELFEGASIFVMTSESENFPMVLLEAMNAGLAIITTRSTGCEEVVGDAALLVAPKDAEAIRAALIKLAGNPDLSDQLGKDAYSRVAQNFDWPVVAEQYVQVYRRAV
jgi:glycosyltransferase involved in cell wall biosynthesis